MFTGIIEETGTIVSFAETAAAYRLVIAAQTILPGLAIGDSVAVNGCCLTVVTRVDDRIGFDLLAETVRLTGFAGLRPGDPVNLERALSAQGRLGGHFVSGHIDAVGTIVRAEARGADTYMVVRPPREFMRYLVYKGSVAIDGISLTVAEVHAATFAVWLIPHTLEVTNLHSKGADSLVNLEFDLLAKYVERLLGKLELPKE
jgi:riboflavin synthase